MSHQLAQEIATIALYDRVTSQLPPLEESEQAVLLEACKAEIELRASSMPKTCPGCGHVQKHNHKRNLKIIRESRESLDLHTKIKNAVHEWGSA